MATPFKSVPKTGAEPTDWTLCVICQEKSDAPLRDAHKARNQSSDTIYTTLANNLKTLGDLNALPSSVNLAMLDDGSGIEKTLAAHNAKWHKNCYVQCSSSRVNNEEKGSRSASSRGHNPCEEKITVLFYFSNQ